MNEVTTPAIQSRAVIMAGGTGGHIFPGIAVAKALQKNGWQVSWIGSVGGMEELLVSNTQIPIDLIGVKGVRGKGILDWIKFPFSLAKAVLEARQIIKKRQPNVVLGFGGFVAGPGGLATQLLSTPLVIHEQNAIAGMTNRVLGIFAERIFEGFSGTFKNTDKVSFVGNPIRQEILTLSAHPISEKESNSQGATNVLVIGGSRGALALNKYLPGIFAELSKSKALNIEHQTGKGRLEETQQFYEKAQFFELQNSKLKLTEFIDDMASSFARADIVICRAGASTVAEIAAAGKCAIFIPYPYAVDDHQTKNAQWLEKDNAAICFDESALKGEVIIERLKRLIDSRHEMNQIAQCAARKAKLDAAENIADYCEKFRKKAA
ncbi:undecaprenyldiphospho-muramoylpentapeptide beta-N-acetylglucosaminyltransferase [Aliikangiella sp. G2MR2-5]|uniref:undecaprenyldiphospho-muramoylpentapeptide beta-N-acetylglucosaminyltransferase n=1 Tax=Aliikangiella sp. G2MR2-5 TaxID=2788943 RepID=UPI0018AC495F|nr:undecaprenyldiphospho-muramoylpentapeptide beta-N-acetylglucosaminyltransferase [Aliikangiella sp. G2MR2-5]